MRTAHGNLIHESVRLRPYCTRPQLNPTHLTTHPPNPRGLGSAGTTWSEHCGLTAKSQPHGTWTGSATPRFAWLRAKPARGQQP